MQALIQNILAAYAMEGISSDAVAMILANGWVQCMAPQQHSANRARSIGKRILRTVKEAYVSCEMVKLVNGGKMETQYMLRVATQEGKEELSVNFAITP